MADDQKYLELKRQLESLTKVLGGLTGDQKVPTFGEYAEKWLEQKLTNPSLRKNTKKSASIQLRKHLIPAFGLLSLGAISNGKWLALVDQKTKEGIGRFFNARKWLISVLLQAKEDGLIDRVPKFDVVDRPKNVGRVLSEQEVSAIFAHLPESHKIFFFCLASLGFRPGEVMQWEWGMIEWRPNACAWINVPERISKTDRARSVPLTEEVTEELQRLRMAHGATSHLVFPHIKGYHSQWRSACKAAGVSKCVPYDFRRTFITNRISNNFPGELVAKALDTSQHMIQATYLKGPPETMEAIMTGKKKAA